MKKNVGYAIVSKDTTYTVSYYQEYISVDLKRGKKLSIISITKYCYILQCDNVRLSIKKKDFNLYFYLEEEME